MTSGESETESTQSQSRWDGQLSLVTIASSHVCSMGLKYNKYSVQCSSDVLSDWCN